jgi:hypothetical protein
MEMFDQVVLVQSVSNVHAFKIEVREREARQLDSLSFGMRSHCFKTIVSCAQGVRK